MTQSAWPITLALDMDLVVGAIGVVIVVGSMIANWLKTQAEARQQQNPSSSKSQAPRDLDELAARRREELREQARSRRQGVGGAGSRGASSAGGGGGGEPGNLTMAERIERARAKEAYRKRAEQMRGGPGRAEPEPSPAAREAAAEAEAARAAAERRRRELAEAEQARDRMAAAQRRQQQIDAEARRRAAAAQRANQRHRGGMSRPAQVRAQPSRGPAIDAAAIERAQIQDTARRKARREAVDVAEAAAATTPVTTARGGLVRGRELGILLSSAATLKQAVIFKEVFDRPLALRDHRPGRF